MREHPAQWIYSGLTCREVTDRTSEYLDDSISILTKIRVGLHLASCSHCRVYAQQIDLVSSTLRSLPKLYPPPINRLRLRQQFAARHAD